MKLLKSETVSVLLSGNTLILRRPDGIEASVYYDADGTAYMQHPEHGRLEGPWALTEHGYTIDWNKNVGRMEWTLGHTGDEIAYLDAGGTQRAMLTQMVHGDAGGLAG